MSWMFTITVERPASRSDAEAESLVRSQYPQATLALASKKKVLVLFPAQLPIEVATLLSQRPFLLLGSASLIWFESFMEPDLRATALQHDIRAATNKRGCSCSFCSSGMGSAASSSEDPFSSFVLAEILRLAMAKKDHDPS